MRRFCLATLSVLLLASFASGQAIGLNFTASDPAGKFPPDPMGAVGLDQVALIMNGRYRVFDKTTGQTLLTRSLDDFWRDSGVNPTSFAFDPRILYDRFNQRWYAVSVDNNSQANNLLVGISRTANLLDGWNGLSIDTDPNNVHWADFPTIGHDAQGVYIAADMIGISSPSFQTTVWALPKSELLSPTPTALTGKTFRNMWNTVGTTVQPVVDQDNTGLPADFYSSSSNQFIHSRVFGPIDNMSLGQVGTVTLPHRGEPAPANQPGTPDNIHTGSSRLSSNLIRQDGLIWGVNSVNNLAGAGLRFFKLDPETDQVVQEVPLGHPTLDTYYGSLAVNEFGDVVIGFSASSDTQSISAFAMVGRTVDGITTFGDLIPLKYGEPGVTYLLQDSRGRNRWGDYSATVVDPLNPFSFWTFQEFATGPQSFGIQITQILIPEPAMLPTLSLALLLLQRTRKPAPAIAA